MKSIALWVASLRGAMSAKGCALLVGLSAQQTSRLLWQAFLLFDSALSNFLRMFLEWARHTKAFQVLRFQEGKCAYCKLFLLSYRRYRNHGYPVQTIVLQAVTRQAFYFAKIPRD